MKLSAITFALMLASASASASASITNFGTKNNTYTPPTPSIDSVPGEVRDKIIQCPSIKEPLPIRISGANSSTLQFDLNVSVLVGKQYQSFPFSPTYSEIYIDRTKFDHAKGSYGYVFNEKYNYVSNNDEFYSYSHGYSPWLAHTIYGNNLYEPGVKDTDKMPIFLSRTRLVRLNSSDLVTLPNRDFSVVDVIFTSERFNINNHTGYGTLYKLLHDNSDPVLIGRATMYKKGNKLLIEYWFWNEWAQPFDIVGFAPTNDPEYKKKNIMSNFKYSGRDITGFHVIEDIRRVKDIQFLVRRTDKNKAGIWGIANERGNASYVVQNGVWRRDSSLSEQALLEEQKFYSENNCFY
ncbi:TPA: hypothetical protein RSW58_003602 [Vibrio cholerae]|nr:hypothetical protein [Vibrio cholerae]